MKFHTKVPVFILAVFISLMNSIPHGFSEENCNALEINEQIVQILIDSHDDSIALTEDESIIQLNPQRLVPCAKGLFLKTKNQGDIFLPVVISNQTGCYIVRSENQANGLMTVPITCRNCKKIFIPTLYNKGVCPHCRAKN